MPSERRTGNIIRRVETHVPLIWWFRPLRSAWTMIFGIVIGLTFIFGFGNVLALGLRLGVPIWVAPLVTPAFQLGRQALPEAGRQRVTSSADLATVAWPWLRRAARCRPVADDHDPFPLAPLVQQPLPGPLPLRQVTNCCVSALQTHW